MADTADFYEYQAQERMRTAAEEQAYQHERWFASLTPRQRYEWNLAQLKTRQPVSQNKPRVTFRPDAGEYSGGDENLYNLQNEYDQLNFATATRTPYLGPTTSVNPYTGEVFRGSKAIGDDVSKVGQAGSLPGTQQIMADHFAHNPRSIQEDYERTGGKYPFPREKMGGFVYNPGDPNDEEQVLQAKAAAGQASSAELFRLSRIRAGSFEFRPDEFKRGAARYVPGVILAAQSAGLGWGLGAAGGAALGGKVGGAALGAGYGAFGGGTVSGWDDPWAVAGGAAGGFLGGWGGSALAGQGASAGVRGLAQGAGSGAGSALGRGAAAGEFDPANVLMGAGAGAASGGLSGTSGLPPALASPVVNYGADQIFGTRRRRNPYQ